jgi:hypothetical protein
MHRTRVAWACLGAVAAASLPVAAAEKGASGAEYRRCADPACYSKGDLSRMLRERMGVKPVAASSSAAPAEGSATASATPPRASDVKESPPQWSGGGGGGSSGASSGAGASVAGSSPAAPRRCPMDRDQLGAATWSVVSVTDWHA